ncbi:SET and MYND domain-containing protein 4 [Nasonia vitripennis]|uniref:Protein-lysine N-methyltransferase SMYD4 n=1 Tax=Nasonia vitripennis TaxID=7425 RepID=A0A7M7QJW7_NASVI|nr:SET and MYND domain-containing protein 4 [Nasonia vitripennis]XP_031787715.1 SET and MYND domain-containing protein 4 [Nasonia vitripennis]XP_032457062.1 SET and MYND domain-containing protein 4 [Nasonia vitripennis]
MSLEDYFDEDYGKDFNKLDEDFEYDVGEFFRDNLIKVRAAIDNQAFRKFATLDDNGARVAFLLNYPECHELPVEVENYERKDPIKAKSLKDSGNTSFGFDHYEVAIEEYNNAVLVAPKKELGVILANRSAAFYHLDKFDLALRDCEEALKVGYPKHLTYKVAERRARCLLGLKSHTKAMEAFKSAIQALDDAKMPSEKKKKCESDMRIMLAMMQKGQQLNDSKGVTKEKLIEMENNMLKEKDTTPKIKECNPLYPSCSKAVEIKDARGDVGRFAVATKDIQPGELLVVEKPHCSMLLGEYRLTHCHRCSIRIVAPYPASCYLCSSVAYCSPNCRDLDERVHSIECGLLGSLWCSKASVTCMMALRAIIQKPYEEFIKAKSELKKTKGKLEIGKGKPFVGRDYKAFCNLVTHEDERTAEDLFHRAYMSAWLLRVLKTSSYLPASVKTPDAAEIALSEGETLVADAILYHLQMLQFNSHEISELVRPRGKPDLSKGKSLFIGGGVFPTVALFNHSCNPGVVRYFIGNTMVVRAIKTIPAGAEISENYGPIFTEEEENDRKRKLRLQYWFDCDCEACKNHWPLLADIDPNVLKFKCETGSSCGNVLPVNINSEIFMIPCSKCGNSTNLFKGLKAIQDTDAIYKSARKNLELGHHDDALKSFLEILKILDETLALPMRDYHLCQQGVRQCMLACGNSSFVR